VKFSSIEGGGEEHEGLDYVPSVDFEDFLEKL
jgi:hypothetical protein